MAVKDNLSDPVVRKSDNPPASDDNDTPDVESTTDTSRPDDSVTTEETRPAWAVELESRVEALERKHKSDQSRRTREHKQLADRVEDVLDYLYGTNVRPPLTERDADAYPAEVKPSNEDD